MQISQYMKSTHNNILSGFFFGIDYTVLLISTLKIAVGVPIKIGV